MDRVRSQRSGDRQNTPADSPEVAAVKPTARSAVSNGSRLFMGVDGRSRQARRWRDCYRELLGRTRGQHEQLCRAASSLIVAREAMDARIAGGENVPTDDLLRLVSELRRIMTRLGLDADETGEDATEQAIAAARKALGVVR